MYGNGSNLRMAAGGRCAHKIGVPHDDVLTELSSNAVSVSSRRSFGIMTF